MNNNLKKVLKKALKKNLKRDLKKDLRKVQKIVLKKTKEVVILLKQTTKLTEELTVEELSRVIRKKLAFLLPKLNLEPIQVPRALNSDLDSDFKPEDNIEQVLIVILKKVKITRPDLFYEDRKKLKAYLV
ncbi:hypothetical protein B7463_g10600, partial [Scytalidium lignicola]